MLCRDPELEDLVRICVSGTCDTKMAEDKSLKQAMDAIERSVMKIQQLNMEKLTYAGKKTFRRTLIEQGIQRA